MSMRELREFDWSDPRDLARFHRSVEIRRSRERRKEAARQVRAIVTMTVCALSGILAWWAIARMVMR